MSQPRYLRFVRALALGGLTVVGCAESSEPTTDAEARDAVQVADSASDVATSPDVGRPDVGTPDVGTPDVGTDVSEITDAGGPDFGPRFIEGPLPPPDLPRSVRA